MFSNNSHDAQEPWNANLSSYIKASKFSHGKSIQCFKFSDDQLPYPPLSCFLN